MRSFLQALFLIILCFAFHGASLGAGQAQEDIPLSEQLEGLAPGPRVAYLRYLLRERGEDPEFLFQLAIAFHESSLPDSALFYYKKTVKADPGFSKAYVNMGVIYDEQGKPSMALSMFEEALRENPDDILAHAHASFIRFHLEDYSKAWDHLSRALKIDPNNSQARFYLAIFFWECGMYREALIEWEKVMEFEPGSHLSKKAQENIIILQKALNAPTSSSDWKPRR